MARFVATVVLACSMMGVIQVAWAQPEEGQYYRIICVSSKMVLAVEEKGKGDRIIQVISGPGEVQKWKFEKVGDYYKIINRKTGKALNVINRSTEEGAAIIQWDASDRGENQQWSLEKKGKSYVIKARHSGLVLDVAEESNARKTPVIQYKFKEGDSDNQHFELEFAKAK